VDLLNEADKKRLGNLIIEQIRDRTRKGTGVNPNGREYKLQNKPYTRKYAKLKGSNKVDLTLTGDMLENMFVSDTGVKTVSISVRDEDYGKLRGAEEGVIRNIRGPRGKPIPGTKTTIKRPFYRLSKNDTDEIVSSDDFRRIFKRATNRFFNKRSR